MMMIALTQPQETENLQFSPLLVVESQEKIYWRFPVGLSLGQQGYLGQVGEVDVDAYTGELLLDGDSLARIEANAQRLAQSTTH